MDKKNFEAFSKDYANYSKGGLTFRELLASVKNPRGELKEAMESYYATSIYRRVFKNR